MKNFLYIRGILLFFCLLSCVSHPLPPHPADSNSPQEKTPSEEPDPVSDGNSLVHDGNVLERMSEYLENGLEKIDYGAVSEGIKQLVAVLAEREKLAGSSPDADELANSAEIELSRLKAALILEPEQSWLDTTKTQLTGSTLDKSPEPRVIVTVDTGMGRAIVANAPVLFRFVKGNGTLTSFVNTSDYGLASCKIINFDNEMEENIIRATLVFKEKGYSYEFEGVERDFVYRPPQKRATILVLEQSPLGPADDPVIFNAVYDKLQNVAFDFSMLNSVLNSGEFQQVYNGDKQALTSLGLDENVSYLVVVFNDVFNVKEFEFNGTPMGVFYSEARATLRIIRISDAKILYQVSTVRQKSDNTHGQGGSVAVAVKNAIDLVSADMQKKLAAELKAINTALTGEK